METAETLFRLWSLVLCCIGWFLFLWLTSTKEKASDTISASKSVEGFQSTSSLFNDLYTNRDISDNLLFIKQTQGLIPLPDPANITFPPPEYIKLTTDEKGDFFPKEALYKLRDWLGNTPLIKRRDTMNRDIKEYIDANKMLNIEGKSFQDNPSSSEPLNRGWAMVKDLFKSQNVGMPSLYYIKKNGEYIYPYITTGENARRIFDSRIANIKASSYAVEDIFTIKFPLELAIWGLAVTNKDPRAARRYLVNNYNEAIRSIETTLYPQDIRNKWTANPKQESCNEITKAKVRYEAELAKLRTSYTDLSNVSIVIAGTDYDIEDTNLTEMQRKDLEEENKKRAERCTELTAKSTLTEPEKEEKNDVCSGPKKIWKTTHKDGIKDENMKYQYSLLDKCRGLIARPARTLNSVEEFQKNACIRLASLDEEIYGILPNFDAVNEVMIAQEDEVLNTLAVLNDVSSLLKCPGTGDIEFQSDTDVGLIDTYALKSKLNDLSPYYISPATLAYVTKFLVGSEDMSSSLYTTKDIMSNVARGIGSVKSLADTIFL